MYDSRGTKIPSSPLSPTIWRRGRRFRSRFCSTRQLILFMIVSIAFLTIFDIRKTQYHKRIKEEISEWAWYQKATGASSAERNYPGAHPPWSELKLDRFYSHDDVREGVGWEFPSLQGFYQGIRLLTGMDRFRPEQYMQERDVMVAETGHRDLTNDMIKIDPYGHNGNRETCYLDISSKLEAPDVYGFQGMPQHMTEHFIGSYSELGLDNTICYERYGRLGPYGFGYSEEEGGLGLSSHGPDEPHKDEVLNVVGRTSYAGIDWGNVQANCFDKNRRRFEEDSNERETRSVVLLRLYSAMEWTHHLTLLVRALIVELNVKTGGEYDIHLFIHVKDPGVPAMSDPDVYDQVLKGTVPEEFWGISSLWSEPYMEKVYPGPFPPTLENPSNFGLHSRFRSGHLPLQWFAQEHPEYDFFWNWEFDTRMTGHHYEFFEKIRQWAKKQPRKGMWERNSHYYVPQLHGTFSEFTTYVREEVIREGIIPVWGPRSNDEVDNADDQEPPHSIDEDNYEWGVGEEADLITFNPIFDPTKTDWHFRNDITGFKDPDVPRRTAIITMSRLSKKLLDNMHRDTREYHHTAQVEMWPATCALHHGLKAVYVPHPVYMEHRWPLALFGEALNYPRTPEESVFAGAQHVFAGSSFWYNAGFPLNMWTRWLGSFNTTEDMAHEDKTGRLCLRTQIFHPVKPDGGEDTAMVKWEDQPKPVEQPRVGEQW